MFGRMRRFGRAGAIMVAALAIMAFHDVFPEGAMAADKATIRITALGDSLTAGWGVPESRSWPRLVEKRLREEGYAATVVNAGVSGDTTAAGRARVGWALADKPDIVVVALGANDALRGLDPKQARANLEAILADLKKRNVRTLLVGMLAPPNLGREYEREFNSIYPQLAEKYGVPLFPFILEGVAGKPGLNQPDGVHPTVEGQEIMAGNIYPYVKKLVEAASSAQSAQGG